LHRLAAVVSDCASAHPAAPVEDPFDPALGRVAARDDFVQNRVDGLLLEDLAPTEAGEKIAQRLCSRRRSLGT
jgi:hypothetical protein